MVLRLCFGLRGILFCTLLLVEHISSLVILIEGDGFGGFSFFLFTFNVDMQALVTLLTSLQILAFSLFWEASCILYSFHDGAVLVNRENMYGVWMQVLTNWSLSQVLSAWCLAEDGVI